VNGDAAPFLTYLRILHFPDSKLIKHYSVLTAYYS